MTTTLPKTLALQSVYNKKYLCYIHEEGDYVYRYLPFSGEDVVSPYTKFQVEPAKIGKGFVHLRCSYSNKYWVRESDSGLYIVARAEQPEEDQSKWSCTLFEPIFIDPKTVRIRHVQLGRYACLCRSAPPFSTCLYAGAATVDNDKCDVYTIIDWESMMILPKYVAFKGDNTNYISARTISGQPYHQIESNDIGDPTVGNEVFINSDGSIHIKSNFFGKLWRRSPNNWIWADTDDFSTNNSDTLFWPVKIDYNVVALRNLGTNNFCKRLTIGVRERNCLNAALPTVTKEAHLEVYELVVTRDIYYVDFRLLDARIYHQSVITMATGSAANRTQVPNTVEVKLSYTDTQTSTWSSIVTLKLGVQSTFQSGVPVIAEGKVKISDELDGDYEWGRTISVPNVVETVYKVALPPMSTVTVSLVATKGSCDVPFSYSQTDTLINGEQITYDMDDGIYTGINCFNFKYETQQKPLYEIGKQPIEATP